MDEIIFQIMTSWRVSRVTDMDLMPTRTSGRSTLLSYTYALRIGAHRVLNYPLASSLASSKRTHRGIT